MNPNLKFHIISDKTKTSQYIKKNILKKYQNTNCQNLIV